VNEPTHKTENNKSSKKEPLVSLRGIHKSFGGIRALTDVSLDIYPGEVLGLVGDNGAGKSVLVKIIAGALTRDKGEYKFGGKPVEIEGPVDATDLGIRTVYQDLALCDNLDAVQNIFLGQEPCGPFLFGCRIQRAECETKARNILKRLRLGQLSLTRPVGAMSGGQRQNIAISRCLLGQPKVLLFDEPTAALSHSAAAKIGELTRELADEGLGILVISHDIHEFVLSVTDRIEVLRLGRIVASFKSREVTGERVVNAMVGGVESENLSR
jgi:simple sugar transport system ATP-binding protein/D-xylose transport system ATP-binding protein